MSFKRENLQTFDVIMINENALSEVINDSFKMNECSSVGTSDDNCSNNYGNQISTVSFANHRVTLFSSLPSIILRHTDSQCVCVNEFLIFTNNTKDALNTWQHCKIDVSNR